MLQSNNSSKDSILSVENLTVSFDGYKVVDGLSLSIEEKELRVIIGPNGAGKTTLIDLISGRTRPTEGTMKFRGIDLKNKAEHEIVGIRVGEKLHEQMIGIEDAPFTYEYDDYFKILPAVNDWYNDKNRIKNGLKVPNNFVYTSDQNTDWMTEVELSDWISENSSLMNSSQ